ncbi:MAG TPA: hypothetical protein VJG13_15485 [Thermoanaerobaculia bacterium]|nr:hypothetical protein [Thermoanaerobaculia bacterium]
MAAGPLVLEGPAAYRETLEGWAARARVFLPELERELGVAPAAPILMVLIPPDTSPYPAVARLDAAAPPWAAGFALSDARVGGVRIARAERYPFGDAVGVLAHEVAHVLIHDAAAPAGGELPRWFAEGVATRAQRRWSLRDAVVYSSALLGRSLPTLGALDRAFVSSEPSARLAYAASFDFIDWSADEYGEDVVRRVLRSTARGRPFAEAWREATGVPLDRSEASWRRTSLALYRWVPAVTGAGTLWLAITLLFLVASWRRRARTRALYERWEEDEPELHPREDPEVRRRDDGGDWSH